MGWKIGIRMEVLWAFSVLEGPYFFEDAAGRFFIAVFSLQLP
jgi:hypothetical protein